MSVNPGMSQEEEERVGVIPQ